MQTVKDLAGSRFDWEQALRDLSRAIPADVTLSALTGDITTGAGGGGSQLRAAISAPGDHAPGLRPRADAGRPPDGAPARHRRRHPRVAAQLGLREASTTRARTTTRARSSCATPSPCGAGKRPKFEVVVFFEQDAAAVATTPTTASGSVERDPDADADRRRPRPAASGATTTTTTTTVPGRGDPVSRTYTIASRPSSRSAPSAATGSWSSRPSASRSRSSSSRSPPSRPSSRRRSS